MILLLIVTLWILAVLNYVLILSIVYLSNGTMIFFFVCVLLANIFFFAYWAMKMFIETRAMMVKKMQKIYLLVCLCMNRRKLERDVIANQIAEENELLREDYMKSNYFTIYMMF